MRQRWRTVCVDCGAALGPGFEPFCPACGGMADIAYDLDRVELRASGDPYVRFRDLLPVRDPDLLPDATRFTPTVHARELGAALGLPWLYLKNETVLLTGTTKDRMAAVALAYLYERGVREFATSSTGNSSTAYIHALERLPELTLYLFTASQFQTRIDPRDSDQLVHYVLRGASFVEAFAQAGAFARRRGITSERGFFNPGRREGLKLAWLEAAEQVPRPIDCYVQAVSSAMGVYGVFQGARQLHALGRSDRLPRLLCVQQETCAPMVSAWSDGSDRIRPEHVVEHPTGIAEAILRGDPTRAYPHVHRIVAESNGTFVAVSEDEMRTARRQVEDLAGISPCFAASAAVAGAAKLRRQGRLSPDEVVLVNLTGRDRPPAAAPRGARWLTRGDEGWIAESATTALR